MIQLTFFDKFDNVVGEVQFQSYLDFEYGDSPATIRNNKFQNAIYARILKSDVPNLEGIQYDFLPMEEMNAR